MPTLIVPFRGAAGKSRLGLPTPAARAALARAMVADVAAACVAVGPTYVVTPDEVTLAHATVVLDPGGGQGAAVSAGLDAAAATGDATLFLVVNADLPCRSGPWHRAGRGGRRDDECARIRVARPIRPALRRGQRCALRRARHNAHGGRPESHR